MRKYLIALGRALWLVLALNGIFTFALTLWITIQFLRNPSARLIQGLAEDNLSLAFYSGFLVLTITVVFLVYFIVALLIFLRRPNDGFALFSAIFLLNFGAATAYPDFAEFIQFYRNAPAWYALPTLVSTLFSWTLLVAFLVLYPDGRFVPRWALLLAATGFVITSAWGLFPEAFSEPASPLGILGAVGAVTMTAGSLYVQSWRYRHHFSPMQRQQAKWFVFALAIYLVSTILYFIFSVQSDRTLTATESIWKDLAVTATGTLSNVLIPIAVGFAILRYRLWDIDLIIRKTLIYTSLTALLALVYFSSVVLLQGLAGSLAGAAQSPLVVVVSTLIIAALSSPLRRRIQSGIDRRFYRKKYDAQQVLAQFAITARDETDMNALTSELARVVQETLEPEMVSVWLKAAKGERPFS